MVTCKQNTYTLQLQLWAPSKAEYLHVTIATGNPKSAPDQNIFFGGVILPHRNEQDLTAQHPF